MKIHTLNTFIKHGLTEWTTWVGMAILLFGLIYYHEINTLIKNILTSSYFADKIVNGLALVAGFAFVMYRESHSHDK